MVGLTDVKDASIGFAFTSNYRDVTLSTYEKLIAAVGNRLFRSLPGRSLEGLRTLTRFSREHRGHTQFWNSNVTSPLLDLPPDYAIDVPPPEYQRGETTLYGKVERVGGVRPRVRLRLSRREVVYGDISEEQSRILGSRLYSDTALRGQATWDANDGSIVYFRVEEILDYERGSVAAAFDELRKASKSRTRPRVDVRRRTVKQPFGFMALLGLLSLTGMLIKNAIVLVDEITFRPLPLWCHLIRGHNENGSFQMPFPQELQRQFSEESGFQTEVTMIVPSVEIVGIIDAVRTIILNWALKLEEDGIIGEALSFTRQEKDAAERSTQKSRTSTGPCRAHRLRAIECAQSGPGAAKGREIARRLRQHAASE